MTHSDQSGSRSNVKTVAAGSVTLAVVDRGHGPPLVLLHGFPLNHSMWQAQIEYFSQSWRVIAPDLRGFGASQVVPGTASMEQMADDVHALLDTLRVDESVVLAGLSMGGYVAFQFWRKYANRLRALVLCDTRSVPDSPEAAEGRLKTAEKIRSLGSTEPLVEAMTPKLFAPQTLREQPKLVEEQRQVMWHTAPNGAAAALLGMAARSDATDYLVTMALPVLVVVGEHDAIASVDEMRQIAQAIAGSEFAIVAGAGHMSPLENPADFNQALEAFLEQLPATR
jgi:pimeloyl-ACP methyl ester carboxylesterase